MSLREKTNKQTNAHPYAVFIIAYMKETFGGHGTEFD